MKFAEFHSGVVSSAGPYTLSENELLAFAAACDLQQFDIDAQTDRAAQSCGKARGIDPGAWIVQRFLVTALANQGDMAKVADAKRPVLKAVPDHKIATLRAKRYSEVPECLRLAEVHWYDGLRNTGVLEK
jgi:hypothetical protein